MEIIRNLKIKNKLIIIILSITLIALLVGFTSIITYTKATLEQSFISEVKTISHVIGSGLVGPLNLGTSIEAEDVLKKFTRATPFVTNVRIYDEKNEFYAKYDRSKEDQINTPPIPATLPLMEFKGNYLHLFQTIVFQNTKFGISYFRVSTRERDTKIKNLFLVMVGGIFLLIPLAFALATKLQAIISKPILDLGSVTKQVSIDANYSIRVQKVNNDEVGMLHDGFNDMMEQIQNRDIQRDKVERSLKSAEIFLSSVMESMPSMVITIEYNGVVTQWNKSAAVVTGINANEANGRSLWSLIPGFKRYKETISSIKDTKKTIQFYKDLININENNLYLNVIIFPLSEAQTPRFVFMVHNVTDTELKEQQLRQSQKMETVGTLAGGLAHDFNNVLGGIIGTISLYKYKISKKREITHDEIEKYFTTIEDSANRASDMVQHLLSLTRKQEFSFTPTDLNQIIRSTIKICKNTFDKSIEIEANFSKGRATSNVDPTQIEQSMLNLCINAAHAMTMMRNEGEKFGGVLSINVERIKTDKYTFEELTEGPECEDFWQISVEDTGVGMNSKTISKIFDPFFTTKGEGKGTGLGLAMVYNIIKQHHGHIDLYSQEGMGTTFHIYLPVYSNDLDKVQKKEKEEIHLGEGMVLVIDDEEIMRQTAFSILEECGYDVMLAANGKEGVQLYRQNHEKIKMVLLDMVMPKMSGKQAYIELAKINQDVKVILVSGFKQDSRVESILSLGVKEFIQKPYSLVKLANTMHRICND